MSSFNIYVWEIKRLTQPMKTFFFNWFIFDKKTTNFYLLMNIYDLINTSIDTKIPL